MDINSVSMSGNLTQDPELKYTGSGLAVTDLRMATNNRVKKNDEYEDDPCFIDVTVFGRTAEMCCEDLRKGSRVGVNGMLKQDRWETEDGQKRSKHKILAKVVDWRRNKGGGTSSDSSPGRDEELPF